MSIVPWLFPILACPLCGSEVEFRPEAFELLCRRCGRRYPVRDGIPDMLPGGGPSDPQDA